MISTTGIVLHLLQQLLSSTTFFAPFCLFNVYMAQCNLSIADRSYVIYIFAASNLLGGCLAAYAVSFNKVKSFAAIPFLLAVLEAGCYLTWVLLDANENNFAPFAVVAGLLGLSLQSFNYAFIFPNMAMLPVNTETAALFFMLSNLAILPGPFILNAIVDDFTSGGVVDFSLLYALMGISCGSVLSAAVSNYVPVFKN